uniref:SDR family oxidoreductase n=1 Tax=Acidobacterium capsulatum TaxID=33075 RepID=A0A7V4XS50_9BACT
MANNYVILGAYGGIGSALTRRLAGAGHRVFLAGRDQARLQSLAAAVSAVGFACADATVSAEVEAAIAEGATQLGSLDGIANCFGSLLLKPAHLTTDEELEATLAISLKSAFATVRAAARTMKQGGSVVLLSSAAARLGMASHEAIAAAKAGVQGLALSAAATYASRNLRVNCVAPGLTKTPLTERITGNEMVAKGSLAMHALGRFGEASEVASAIAWLLDPEQSWVTGQVIGVDGGLATVRTRG